MLDCMLRVDPLHHPPSKSSRWVSSLAPRLSPPGRRSKLSCFLPLAHPDSSFSVPDSLRRPRYFRFPRFLRVQSTAANSHHEVDKSGRGPCVCCPPILSSPSPAHHETPH